MEMPDDYIKEILGFNSKNDLIENLYLRSLIEAYPHVFAIPGVLNFDENHIRDEFQKVICFNCGDLSAWLNNSLITLTVENQIITKDNERKRTDIAFVIPNLKYVIECKKLKGVSKEQYITKGISRFVKHEYINEHETVAGMCSFISGGSVANIIKGSIERLQQYNFISIDENKICGFADSFSSTHKKINDAEIVLNHLFFNLVS
jgi:hypothetical protein